MEVAQPGTAPSPSGRMKFPDGLRAVAAMIVVLPHSAGLFSYWHDPSHITRIALRACHFGVYGVEIFFVLSGFVIAYTLREQKLNAGYFGKFLLRRSIRLDPPYWAAIALYYVYLIFQSVAAHKPLHLPGTAQLVSHLFYLQNLLHYGDINVVFWTLCLEIQFYIVFCLLVWASQRIGQHGKQFFMVMFIASLAWPMNLVPDVFPRGLFLPYWYAFLAGAITWWVVDKKLRLLAGYTSIILLLAVALFGHNVEALFVACTAGSLLAASYRNNLYHWLNVNVIQFLGKLSYCIYLVHGPVVGVIIAFQARLAPHREATSYILVLVIWLLVIGVAYPLHVLVEAPALRWSKRLKNWGVAAPSGALNPKQTQFLAADLVG
jgi:peptidoglycan/LPS O-acetylase OafA/YrhL